MQKQMKMITTAGILGLFLMGNYAFEFLGKIGAGVFSAVLTGQLTPEAWNSELNTAIWQQSLPFLLMIVIGGAFCQWSKGRNAALEASEPEWAASSAQRKESSLAVAGALLAFSGFYNLFMPIYFGYQDLIMGLSSPESAGYVLKAVLPNYLVLLVQMALGFWLVIGKKSKEAAIAETVESEEAVSPDAEDAAGIEASPDPVDTEKINQVL